ncbi:MAG: hypothetical protein EPN36_14250 [Rhodanobacteraceae bacterium]|nr:MAG: hypothetical protein EPN36_14250 [Rhodanobacteraceae bacterium]
MSDTTPHRDESGPVDPSIWGETDDASSFGFLELAKAEPAAPARKRQPAMPVFDGPGLLERAPAADQTASRLRLDSAVRGGTSETWSDWEDEQVPFCRLFARMCHTSIRPSTPPNKRAAALRWCFGHALSDGAKRVTFAQTCHMLEVRPYVMQSAIQHYLFRRGIVLDGPLSESARLHESFAGAATRCGWNGVKVATDVWCYPSRAITQVIAGLADAGVDDADETIAALVDAGILGLTAGRVWFAARSAEFVSSRRTSFARSFLDDQDETTFLDGGPDVLTPEERETLFGTGDYS